MRNSLNIEQIALTTDSDNNEEHLHLDTERLEYTDPKNWPTKKKWTHILIVASMTMSTPLASAIHTPALEQVAIELSVDESVASLSVPTYVLGFATGPLLIAPLSKVFGRLPIYNTCNLLLMLGNVGCALAPDMGWLLVFRFLAGCAGASPITQGSGTIADIIEKEKRGRAVALVAFGSLWGPMLGPAAGGRIVETKHQQPTSTAPLVGPKSPLLSSLHRDDAHQPEVSLFRLLCKAVGAPFRLTCQPIFFTVAAISAFFYSLQIFLYVDIPKTYKTQYSFPPSKQGLVFLGTGIGMTMGLLTFGLFSDQIMIRLAGTGPRKPEYRLPLMMISTFLASFGLATYALTASPSVTWIIPIIGNVVTGAGLYSISMSAATYLIDLSPEWAVDSAAMLSIVRFPTGAVVSALSEKIVVIVSRTVLKEIFAAAALGALPVIYVLYKKGGVLRAKYSIVSKIDG
ncbi:MFS general substrate transporter [Zopfia rhizophila CBS 207.26]|uniref:MFS general substrate transporter n=1 Tax=Zopfia rhizophila CBS 207.26 TaxID=1314779 RepID=A0A6A6EG58_9PEZI|nr:MFS general substrate transporter [Zopfia rhizophila CBS 207.26]